MANNKSIQILRGDANAIANNPELVLLDGQPLYDKDNHNLYIGDGTTTLANLNTVNYIKTDIISSTVAIGNNASASGKWSVALGFNATANGNNATALGYCASAFGNYATALGMCASASNYGATALGFGANANKQSATALGNWAKANNLGATALGNGAKASNDSATAIGNRANASGGSSIAIGHNANSTTDNSICIGNNSSILRNDSISLGCSIYSCVPNSIMIGTNINMRTGNGAFSASEGIFIGNNLSGSSLYTGWVIIGSNANIGSGGGGSKILIGSGQTDRSPYGHVVSIGGNSTTYGSEIISIGSGTDVKSDYGIGIGSGRWLSLSSANNGAMIDSNSANAVVIGANSYATNANNSVVIGTKACVTAPNTVVLGGNYVQYLRCQVQTISSLSDRRVKEDIQAANTAQCLVDVNRLPVSRFKYKEFTGNHIDKHRTGFLADDVEKVFPKAVSYCDETFPELDEGGNKIMIPETDEEGNPVYKTVVNENGEKVQQQVMREKTFILKDVKSIAVQDAIPTLWGAVQELTKRLEVLENK